MAQVGMKISPMFSDEIKKAHTLEPGPLGQKRSRCFLNRAVSLTRLKVEPPFDSTGYVSPKTEFIFISDHSVQSQEANILAVRNPGVGKDRRAKQEG